MSERTSSDTGVQGARRRRRGAPGRELEKPRAPGLGSSPGTAEEPARSPPLPLPGPGPCAPSSPSLLPSLPPSSLPSPSPPPLPVDGSEGRKRPCGGGGAALRWNEPYLLNIYWLLVEFTCKRIIFPCVEATEWHI